ncbi:peptidase [Desulfuromonas versatilis]|uniref:Peptidase n=1 Tax=Desulfuromonas versatilis TaxID=2802975 RepID=A0ABN6E283_9BACT|nr:DegQ family serine endoprotease [Desulfuromonas versatilis]BCR06436.1 peptidase [Desulfuromonas versatilis]
MKRSAIGAVALLAALLFLAGLPGCREQREARVPTSVRDAKVKPPVEKPAPELLSTQAAFIEVSQKVTPSVVNISAERMRSAGELGPLFENFFGDLFGDLPQAQRKEHSLGSGFLISADGYILTNEHVVKGAEQIKVKLSDQRVYDGQVVGIDPRTDVAVLKIETREKLTAAVLGDSEALQVGQWALAIGNPFGLDRTLTVGVISATGRTEIGIEDYENFIQTDASINPGNSGGPLLNIYGEVVGINTAIVASGQGIGFAIPINMAKAIADQLIEKGEVTRGWLGVSIQPLNQELAESFGLDQVTGALVNQVLPDTPAERAGVRRGDILLGFNGRKIRGVRDLQQQVAGTPAGEQVSLEVLRDGKRLNLQVALAAQQAQEAALEAGAAPQGEVFGLSVAPAEGNEGVLVEAVDEASPAAAAGVQPGDLILSVNRREVKDLASFDRAVQEARDAKNVVLLVRRAETTLYLAFAAP